MTGFLRSASSRWWSCRRARPGEVSGRDTLQAFLPVWAQKDFGKWTTYGGGGYWINPGPGNRDYWYVGWLLQRQLTDKLAIGAEVFHTTSSMVGRDGVTGFNVGGQYDIHRALSPALLRRPRRLALRCRRRPGD